MKIVSRKISIWSYYNDPSRYLSLYCMFARIFQDFTPNSRSETRYDEGFELSVLHTKKSKIITILKENEFNCFPVPYGTKEADYRYKASRTQLNQSIDDKENFGYIATNKNCTVDFDHEKYNETLDIIAEKFMVIKTAHNGRHLPVMNLGTNATKIELFDYSIQDKKIIEIQGNDHYCVGAGSKIIEDGKTLEYENIGTDVIFNAQGKDFESFIEYVCNKFNVKGIKKTRNQNDEMRKRFIDGKPPTPHTSNSYFFQSAIACNTKNKTRDEAIEEIRKIYDEWVNSSTFSGRQWSNVLTAINKVYDENLKVTLGRNKESDTGVDRTEIALDITQSRQLHSNMDSETIYQKTNGFLESINGKLRKQLQQQYPKMTHSDFKEIESKILGLVPDIPERNKDLIVFRNETYSIKEGKTVESDDLAHTGFKDYDYNEKANPKKFLEIMFNDVPKTEHGRLKAGLASILKPYLDPKLTVIHGLSGVGKSTGISIIAKLLGQYAMVTELNQMLFDRATKANLKGKLFLVIQELPNTWKYFSQLKIILGEQRFSGRKNHGDHDEWDNTIKAFSSANYLPAIPDEEQNSMHSRRLSLIHNERKESFVEDTTLEEQVIKEEGSDILSYLVNLMKEENKYEDKEINQEEWELLSNPEDEIIKKNYDYLIGSVDISLFHLVRTFKDEFKIKISKSRIEEAFQKAGFNVFGSQVKNCFKITKDDDEEKQPSLDSTF
jgi:phage/plasmid-associated DNA primase